MNVSLQNNDKVSALLTVTLEKADYEENVEKTLKNYRKTAQLPGFRKGMAPMGLIKKMAGKSVLADEVNKVLGEAVNKYIQDNKVQILGEPLPNENQQQIDLEKTDEPFVFLFDLALAPEFEVSVSKDDKVTYYDVEVTEEMVEQQVKSFADRNGKYEKVDAYQDNDVIKGLLAELDENGSTKEGGIQVEGAVMMPNYMKNDEQKALFQNAKVNDVLVFNPYKAWDGNEAELASLLKIEKTAVADMKSDFSFQVEEITRYMPGELNQDIFDNVFGPGVVKTVEEFKAKVKDTVVAQFAQNSDFRFLLDLRTYLMNKVGNLEFSEALLKRIMKTNNPDKDDKFIEDNFKQSIEELKWQLIRDRLIAANNIKVENAEITQAAKDATRAQFAQYGMLNIPEELLNNYAQEMLKKRESVESLFNRVVEDKLVAALKPQVTLENKSISAEDFNKLFEA
ncbi:MAG: trigger factor [Bacteroidaceae bacterium]|nr:trigger factor [Bacteroidaceae bacterium]MBQ9884553.1 trigger factor [Bacteroidaceae bacterium]